MVLSSTMTIEMLIGKENGEKITLLFWYSVMNVPRLLCSEPYMSVQDESYNPLYDSRAERYIGYCHIGRLC